MIAKTRILIVRYDNRISQSEISYFRGAVIASMQGIANELYHNHSTDSVVYRYPKIQYKRINQCAAIVGINEGADAIGQFLSCGISCLSIGERKENLIIKGVQAEQYIVKEWDTSFEYHLRKWLPLNTDNYKNYITIESLSEKVAFLERILIGNILSFAKGIDVTLAPNIICQITSMDTPRLQKYKGVKMMMFDVIFKTNVLIPDYIGIGKGVSLGFGIIKRISKDNYTEKEGDVL